MDQFEAYFRRADLDRDGRISGAEAVAFFQGSNLPKQVLAQIWMHADHARTGFLGRAEFSNALKLVTVAQSKRELTPDMVKAALYGPASAKIPPPQINLAAIPAPQQNSLAPAPTPQMGPVAPTSLQNVSFRGQVPPNATMNQQYYPLQGNQTMRPPLPPSSVNAARPPQAVPSPDLSRGVSVAGPTTANSNIASNWLGGVSSGASHVPNQGSTQSMPSAGARPPYSLSSPSLPATKDSQTSAGSRNGIASDAMFGGDVFSATQPLPKHGAPTYSVSSSPASSTVVPVSAGPQSSTKSDPFDLLQSSFSQQPVGNQLQHAQTPSKPSQHVSVQNASSVPPSVVPGGPGNSASNQSQLSWPKMTRAGIQKYTKVFMDVDTDRDGKITGDQARNLFLSWRLPREVLKQVWDLSDQDNDSMLSLREFCIALYLMERYREGNPLPPALPSNILLDEALLSMTGQPNAAYGNATWGNPAGFRPQQGMPVVQPMAPAAGLRPPVPGMLQQNARVPSMGGSPVNQLSNGEQNSADSNFHESAETEKNVENKEKVLLDSRDKIEFYRTKMQDLVLYKSRCDNRLNEITERALADKREAELLGKKYEEKYKQVAETASKLTIEEAAFREIQERKMELHQAIIKMEQGGSADGILQVRADRIQSDLEELIKALTERCKKHGMDIKSMAVIELPTGWQPGIPEVSSVWDEDWDKFEDEGFSFDGAKTNSVSVEKENGYPNDSLSPDSLPHSDVMSEKSFSKSGPAFESESAYTHSDDESGKSPSQDYSDNHFSKSPEADAESHRGFDEPSFGSFDNNDDVDSIWGFNPVNTKDSGHEKHFFDDSVPSTPFSRAGNSPPGYGVGSVDPFFDSSSRFDSFSMPDDAFSPRRETFSRFDSMNSNQGTLTRFDSINSNVGYDRSRFSSFDDNDPFGSSGPFKVSSESQNPRKGSDNWNSF
ncbi:hypothetical protein RHMOL_Rhmol06G0013900 [Rhododendron molle]|uniref:Uncharacterized protein n=1 Tax=Rhododendron molle TaxID=49168 RepID=A0ACC0N867_RHOML|nr:hypothetical protein RHMOL_Rhmol06G0013900 [Rhododendron molle]